MERGGTKAPDSHLLELSLWARLSLQARTQGLTSGDHAGGVRAWDGAGQSQASPASSVSSGCVTGAKGLSHVSLSLQLCKMGLFAHLFPSPPRVPSVRHGAPGLPVSGWRRWRSPADMARSPPGAAHFPFLGLFFLLCKNGDNDSTSHEGRCEGFHERIHFKQPAPSAALGDPGGSDPLPLSPSAGSSETKISPRAPPCGGRGNATQRSRQGGVWVYGR